MGNHPGGSGAGNNSRMGIDSGVGNLANQGHARSMGSGSAMGNGTRPSNSGTNNGSNETHGNNNLDSSGIHRDNQIGGSKQPLIRNQQGTPSNNDYRRDDEKYVHGTPGTREW